MVIVGKKTERKTTVVKYWHISHSHSLLGSTIFSVPTLVAVRTSALARARRIRDSHMLSVMEESAVVLAVSEFAFGTNLTHCKECALCSLMLFWIAFTQGKPFLHWSSENRMALSLSRQSIPTQRFIPS